MTVLADRATFTALGTTAVLVVSDSSMLPDAVRAVERIVSEVDRACSRFRDDSDLARVNARPDEDVAVSECLVAALDVALRGARATRGLVDPTVGVAVREVGYDRDFGEVDPDGPPLRVNVRQVPGWQTIRVDRGRGTVRVAHGVELDLGATAKAWCADRAAHAAAQHIRGGVIVGLGGDLACAGRAPDGGWHVRVADDHRAGIDEPGGQTVAISGGGIATSGTSVRRWARGGRHLHHVVDPSTSQPARECWRTVSVAADTCTDANIASTASIVLGADAPAWLTARNLPARLVAADGTVTIVGGWPGL
jgi:thiamine biosynthesis lipoprotein